MTSQRTTTKVAAALALLLSAMAAEATPITVDFTVTSNDVSNPSYGSGVTGSGYSVLQLVRRVVRRVEREDRHGIALITVGEVARVDYSRWPNVASWIARMKDRPTWAPVNDAFYKYLVQPHAQTQFEAL